MDNIFERFKTMMKNEFDTDVSAVSSSQLITFETLYGINLSDFEDDLVPDVEQYIDYLGDTFVTIDISDLHTIAFDTVQSYVA